MRPEVLKFSLWQNSIKAELNFSLRKKSLADFEKIRAESKLDFKETKFCSRNPNFKELKLNIKDQVQY